MDGFGWWIDFARSVVGEPVDLRSIEQMARRRGCAALATIAARLEASPAIPSIAVVGHGQSRRLAPNDDTDDHRPAPGPAPSVAVRCFGGLEVTVDGTVVDLTDLRPRARSVLSLVAAHGGAAVHRDVLCTHLWPDDDARSATGKLQVAVSSIRRVLRDRCGARLIERTGESYQLIGARIDLADFWSDADSARAGEGVTATDPAAAERALAHRRGGGLLPELGPLDWLVDLRRRIDDTAARLAVELAEERLANGDPGSAAAWCREALAVDRWSDGAWRCLINALDAGSDIAGATRARREYADVLVELDVVPGEI
jgi:DNA-binding SARP family transcriptional activator